MWISTEMDERKLFIGGIAQETSEATLREYFGNYGGVKEIEIPRDRITGNGRGFGFVTFDEPSVAKEVINGVHSILGRTVRPCNLSLSAFHHFFSCVFLLLFRDFVIDIFCSPDIFFQDFCGWFFFNFVLVGR